MNQQRFQYLLDQYVLGEITPDDRRELAALMAMPEYQPLLNDLLLQSFRNQPLQPLAADNAVEKLLHTRLGLQPAPLRRSFLFRPHWWQAAAVLLLLAAALWIWLPREKNTTPAPGNIAVIAPGSDKAVLTLANGQRIVLDSAANGTLAHEKGVTVLKLDSGALAYHDNNKSASQALTWNSLSTPKGGQYRLILPDGTRVWLNAATTISFPVAFTANNRQVKLTGEAYFEVTQNAQKPFIVTTGETDIRVLGTAFNVMAYREEGNTATTLVSGSVAVSDKLNQDRMLLQPAQQAVLDNGGNRFRLLKPDMEQVTAWKDGFFIFDKTDLKAMMRQIERWYNVTVEYSGQLNNISFTGRVARTEYAAQLLELLEMEGRVHFLLTGNHIIVKPGPKK